MNQCERCICPISDEDEMCATCEAKESKRGVR